MYCNVARVLEMTARTRVYSIVCSVCCTVQRTQVDRRWTDLGRHRSTAAFACDYSGEHRVHPARARRPHAAGYHTLCSHDLAPAQRRAVADLPDAAQLKTRLDARLGYTSETS
jgi:hypothetical protein